MGFAYCTLRRIESPLDPEKCTRATRGERSTGRENAAAFLQSRSIRADSAGCSQHQKRVDERHHCAVACSMPRQAEPRLGGHERIMIRLGRSSKPASLDPAMSGAHELASLNAAQRRAVEHGVIATGPNVAGPLLVIAGAGSGKTSTLAHRVAHLIVHGTDPGRILLLTFSRRSAAEMERRARRLIASATKPESQPSLPWSGTFHAVGARLLRMYAHSIGLDPGFTVHDREDSADLMNLVRHELGFSEKGERFPLKATCLSIYSRAANAAEPLHEVLRKQFPWCASWEQELRALFDSYVEAKLAQHVLDYDDLLLYWGELMKVPELARDVGGRFDHVLVDEYQDTNALQAAILTALKPDGTGLTVVGDDAQAIYGFRAASVRNILDFPRQFPSPARIVTLEQNYRSTQPILTASNAVIGLARERFTKDLCSDRTSGEKPCLMTVQDDAAQADCIVTAILENREAGTALKEQAVLFRTSHHSALLEIELSKRNIPFVKFGGLKFIEAAHVKDMLAVLRWAENPADRVTGFRVLQLLEGVGPSTAGKVLDRMGGASSFEALAGYRPPLKAAPLLNELVALMHDLRAGSGNWPAELDQVRQWYEPHLERRYPDAVVRAGDLDQLQRIAGVYTSRQAFLIDLTLDPPSATSDEAGRPRLDEDYLILSTIHSAKGQEWKSVFVLNVVDGCIPSDMATGSADDIEEERRLLYVAMTRAKDQLWLMVPQRFYVQQQARRGDRHLYAARTRFIPAEIGEHFERRSWAAVRAPLASHPPPLVPIDLRERLRGMWRQAGT
jgi:DNA helicase-2/ATP-dependent DNA helicase PcrA